MILTTTLAFSWEFHICPGPRNLDLSPKMLQQFLHLLWMVFCHAHHLIWTKLQMVNKIHVFRVHCLHKIISLFAKLWRSSSNNFIHNSDEQSGYASNLSFIDFRNPKSIKILQLLQFYPKAGFCVNQEIGLAF